MKLRGIGLVFGVIAVAAFTFGCSPALEKGGASSPSLSSSSASEIPATREAEPEGSEAVGTTTLTSVTLPQSLGPMLPVALWDHWDDPPAPKQTWGIEQPAGPDGF